MTFKCFALALFSSLAVVGCMPPLVPFTQALRARVGEENLQKLQFYASDKMILRRTMGSEEKEVTPGHAFRIERNVKIEELIILPETPGVVIDRTVPAKLAVSFESGQGGDDLWLVFGVGDNPAEKDTEKQFYLPLADRWDGFETDIQYGGKTFRWVVSGQSMLKVRMSDVEKIEKSSRTLPGRRVGD